MKDSIKIILTTEQKKDIKRAALESDKTISNFILDLIFKDNNKTSERIDYITEQLQRHGSNMTAEQRAKLKAEKKALLEKMSF